MGRVQNFHCKEIKPQHVQIDVISPFSKQLVAPHTFQSPGMKLN